MYIRRYNYIILLCNDIMNCGQFVKVSGKFYNVLVIVIITVVAGLGNIIYQSKNVKCLSEFFILSSGLLYLYLQYNIIQCI